MQPQFSFPFEVTHEEAIKIQNELSNSVIKRDVFSNNIRLVAGIDVAYSKTDTCLYAGIVVLDATTFQTIETSTFIGTSVFPYYPGLFAFRELPSIIEAMKKLTYVPDIVICDAQGIAHPRRFGLASHFGLLYDIPTIGCGKTLMIGNYHSMVLSRGSFTPLIDNGEEIGYALCTQDDVKPLFVSVGHRISLRTAKEWVLRLANKYRQTEPIRRANQLVCELRQRSYPCPLNPEKREHYT